MDQERNDSVVTPAAEYSARKKRLTRAAFSAGSGDEKKRRVAFLLLDVLLLALIAAAIVFTVFLLTPSAGPTGDGEARKITYTVEMAGVEKTMLGTFRVGDTVTDRASGAVLGVITAVGEPRPYAVYADEVSSSDPSYYEVPKIIYPENLKTLTITISVDADFVSGVGYSAEDCRIAVGRAYQLNFPGYTGNAVCIGMEEAK
jgi:hypothetical protein